VIELAAMTKSPDVQVQVAIAARKIEGADPLPLLVEVLAHCGEDRSSRTSSGRTCEQPRLAAFTRLFEQTRHTAAAGELLANLSRRVRNREIRTEAVAPYGRNWRPPSLPCWRGSRAMP
jgi:hypothetical protein